MTQKEKSFETEWYKNERSDPITLLLIYLRELGFEISEFCEIYLNKVQSKIGQIFIQKLNLTRK